MKKTITDTRKLKKTAKQSKVTVGLDLGDRTSRYCVLNQEGEVVQAGSGATTKKDLNRVFGAGWHGRLGVGSGSTLRG